MKPNIRKYLDESEINSMIENIKKGLNAWRDRCMISMCFIHGLRASELRGLTLDNIELDAKRIYIPRLKNGLSVQHPLHENEIVMLNHWLEIRKSWHYADQPWLFLSRKGGPISRQQIYRLIRDYGKNANIQVSTHPHMLRHACGYFLANLGMDTRLIQDYLGHRNIQHTVLYTASNAMRFQAIEF
ncbi:Tyrosine recombinase XerD [Serratia quinivorans]|uniref:Tyrosine-type DNA invertase n=1 Tax=Serratia quinivorans TaxID=137545 RepID=A0ABV3UPN3_9GAMM|nr:MULTISPECIES: tyrosine-type DNA invertase [Serratia]CAI0804984.1 Tyrosine recombinase XerD [Serratia quinivorans]CAI1037240.1 Tyrosine recombinase XerD [Serratia quinivorans]CAI1716523.1 Tyrosine recombinase XerD [Serratia quinivorans]CAI1751023.1 Tyrosine recombinase XerD [Serratia quinivorans]CAI1796620.1 Tyrosine recombinase XerD [Serratia quinivorans]